MQTNLLFLLVFMPFVIGCGAMAAGGPAEAGSDHPPQASLPPVIAPLTASDGSAAGQVAMRQGPHGALLIIEGENWPQGWHGVHLHAVGNCETPAFTSAGSHINHPETARPHGLLNWDGGPDYGDLPNIYAHADGVARAEAYISDISLAQSNGLALVVHANADDHQTQPIGGAGGRIACAVLSPAH